MTARLAAPETKGSAINPPLALHGRSQARRQCSQDPLQDGSSAYLNPAIHWHLTRPVAALILGVGLLLTGCRAAPPPTLFTEADAAALANLCVAPPCPVSYSGVLYQSEGHLRQVLSQRRFISAAEYLQLLADPAPQRLKNRAALIILEHRVSHVPSGMLILLFDPTASQDLLTVERMFSSEPGLSSLDAAATFPIHWYRADNEPDFIQDSLLYMDVEVRAQLVDSRGEPQYVWRWGQP
ncbi:MAG: hypothetical protein GEEBNDBF_01046 [bacterium]|nr:hypothetical protein [bacterium]